MNFRWWITRKGNLFYARRSIVKPNGIKTTLSMHREIVKPNNNEQCDHLDHNGLNNQRSNLRKVSNKQNSRNKRSRSNSSSKYLGVCKSTYIGTNGVEHNRWRAQIGVDYKNIKLGSFPYNRKGEIAAAKAYDNAAKQYFGDFANLNFPITI